MLRIFFEVSVPKGHKTRGHFALWVFFYGGGPELVRKWATSDPQRKIHFLTNTHRYGKLHIGLEGPEMRTNIEIDDRLMREAMRSSGKATKRARVEAGFGCWFRHKRRRRSRRCGGRSSGRRNLHARGSGTVSSRPGRGDRRYDVWIDYLGGVQNAEADWLDREVNRQRLVDGPDSMRGFARHSR